MGFYFYKYSWYFSRYSLKYIILLELNIKVESTTIDLDIKHEEEL